MRGRYQEVHDRYAIAYRSGVEVMGIRTHDFFDTTEAPGLERYSCDLGFCVHVPPVISGVVPAAPAPIRGQPLRHSACELRP